MGTKGDDPFVVVIVKEQDWRLLEGRLAANDDRLVRINVDRNRFPNKRLRRICLLVHDGRIVGLCLARYQSTSADVDHMIGLDHIRGVKPVLSVQWLTPRIQVKHRKPIIEAIQRGELLNRAETREVSSALGSDALLLAILEELRELAEELPRLAAEVALRRSEQRDAIALPLEAVGLDSVKTLPKTDRVDGDSQHPYIEDVRRHRPDEGAILRQEVQRVPGWTQTVPTADDWIWTTFADPDSGKDRISIAYGDKTPIERVTGTDLVYFRRFKPGFVLVQYKRMRAKNGRDVYRPNDQLHEEIDRMRRTKDSNPSEWFNTPDDYRLASEAFYLKIVDSQVTRKGANHLADGMYFPLPLFERMLESDDHLGPRKATAITRANAPMHLSNSLFIQLLKGGWIGTAGPATVSMEALIDSLITDGRSVILAEDLRDPNDRSDR